MTRLALWTTAVLAGAAGLTAAPGRAATTNALRGLVLHLRMDELREGALVDAVTSNAVGRATNARVVGNGKLGSACEFADKESFVQIPDAPELNPKRLTVAVWFKCGKEAWTTRYLLEKGVEQGYALSIMGGNKDHPRRGRLRATVGGRDVFSDTAVNDGNWRHALLTADGKAVRLYLDGVLQKDKGTQNGDLPPTAHPLTLGMNRSAKEKDHALDGQLDELMLFSRALDEAEIKRVLAAVRPKFTKQQVERRLKELKELYDRGLLRQDFYERKVEECEVVD